MKDLKDKKQETGAALHIWEKLKDLPMMIFGIPGTVSSTFEMKGGHPDILTLTSKIPAAIGQLEELIGTFRVKQKSLIGNKDINVFNFDMNKEYIKISVNSEILEDPALKKQADQIMKMNWLGASAVLHAKGNVNV
jgi:hypothetical protein